MTNAGQVLYGTVPDAYKGSGDGYGSGSGYGDGDGYGSGYGYGSGSGYGDGDGYGSGSGYGYGSGSGSGYGDGYGYGYGYGYGSGYGDGYGDGDGYGSGSGSGYGSGYGYGSGDGDGSGDGSGYGDGSKEYWSSVLPVFIKAWPADQVSRLEALKSEGATIAYWRSSGSGKPCNGGSGDAVAPGLIQKIKGPLQLCGSKALHGTMTPPAWKGDRIWIVALIGEVQWQDDKCGALCREIVGEITQ